MYFNTKYKFIDFVLKEWLLFLSGLGFVLTSLYMNRFPQFSVSELETLLILFALFVVVEGLRIGGLILRISQKIQKGKNLTLKLILLTFSLSMLVTNDIAILIIVPLTLTLDIDKKEILVILETLAANAGSALTPIGNPQNIFIYWSYGIKPLHFIYTIAPFSLLFLVLLIFSSLLIKTNKKFEPFRLQKIEKISYVYVLFLLLIILTVVRVLPVALLILVPLYSLFFDKRALSIDYALLISFFLFFGFADNIKILLGTYINRSEHIFLFSAISSQLISNVPATVLFAEFTTKWKALLWGVNVGGFGSLFGSLANLIAYKIYITQNREKNNPEFTAKFLLIGYFAFFLSVGLYFLLY